MLENMRAYRNDAGQPVVETRFRVRFYETDQMGVVHHAVYITWFEEGRSAFTRAIGYPYSRLEAEGISLAVAELSARYHRPARYDEEIMVATCLTAFASRGMSFSYQVRRATDGELLVSGTSRHISVDRSGRVVLIPEAVRERLTAGIAAAMA
ncbi:MAG: acyl-CoA thioesterase [Anaerolineae bacterium]